MAIGHSLGGLSRFHHPEIVGGDLEHVSVHDGEDLRFFGGLVFSAFRATLFSILIEPLTDFKPAFGNIHRGRQRAESALRRRPGARDALLRIKAR